MDEISVVVVKAAVVDVASLDVVVEIDCVVVVVVACDVVAAAVVACCVVVAAVVVVANGPYN